VSNLPQPPTDEDPFETIRRFQRTPATFSCMGMGCRTTLVVIVLFVIALFLLMNRFGS
jgi:hypothetical protein